MKSGQKSNYCEHCGDFHDPVHEYVSSVKVGEPIPDYPFEVYHKDEVKEMKFSDLKGKWFVVMFYPADFTFVCPTELEEMATLYPKFQELGAEIISFSTDTVFVHKAWHDTSPAIRHIDFPMGADPSGKIACAFGVLVEGEEFVQTEGEGCAMRGTFIIDPNGILRSMEVTHNSIGRKAAETLRKIQAAQYVEKHPGNVCPASWEEGDEGMTPGMGLVGKI
ncbi:redoxin domain-containing protein [Candidatus Parcubacteria bacterium]|nr:redoxin domain-containing protein [Candidatus Parcubacteria bacterium]